MFLSKEHTFHNINYAPDDVRCDETRREEPHTHATTHVQPIIGHFGDPMPVFMLVLNVRYVSETLKMY